MYKCLDCGHIFEQGEQVNWKEDRGEFWGSSCGEKISGCPICKGDYEETKRCEICGSEHLADDLISGVCEDCFEKHSQDVNVCYQSSKEEKETVQLNLFLTRMYDAETIEEILLEHLIETKSYLESHKANMQEFVDEDKEWFAEKIVEVLKDEK